eukprot:1345836-Amorphochlora_amoeboformis.AAC.1
MSILHPKFFYSAEGRVSAKEVNQREIGGTEKKSSIEDEWTVWLGESIQTYALIKIERSERRAREKGRDRKKKMGESECEEMYLL